MGTWRPSQTEMGKEQYFPPASADIMHNTPTWEEKNSWWTGKWYIKSQGSVCDCGIWNWCWLYYNIRRIIHIGVPYTMEEYCQEVGWVGRDGLPVRANIYYNSYDVSKAHKNKTEGMRTYVQIIQEMQTKNYLELFWSWCSQQSTPW